MNQYEIIKKKQEISNIKKHLRTLRLANEIGDYAIKAVIAVAISEFNKGNKSLFDVLARQCILENESKLNIIFDYPNPETIYKERQDYDRPEYMNPKSIKFVNKDYEINAVISINDIENIKTSFPDIYNCMLSFENNKHDIYKLRQCIQSEFSNLYKEYKQNSLISLNKNDIANLLSYMISNYCATKAQNKISEKDVIYSLLSVESEIHSKQANDILQEIVVETAKLLEDPVKIVEKEKTLDDVLQEYNTRIENEDIKSGNFWDEINFDKFEEK